MLPRFLAVSLLPVGRSRPHKSGGRAPTAPPSRRARRVKRWPGPGSATGCPLPVGDSVGDSARLCRGFRGRRPGESANRRIPRVAAAPSESCCYIGATPYPVGGALSARLSRHAPGSFAALALQRQDAMRCKALAKYSTYLPRGPPSQPGRRGAARLMYSSQSLPATTESAPIVHRTTQGQILSTRPRGPDFTGPEDPRLDNGCGSI